MARRKRSAIPFNLSFLDIMSCGFGAVVLVFLIIDHSVQAQSDEINRELLAEVNFMEEEVEEGQAGLVALRNTLSDVDLKLVEAQGRATRITDETADYEARIQSLLAENPDGAAEVGKLQAEIQSLEREVEKLRAAASEDSGRNARGFIGEGNRQYLTGLKLGGQRIAILVDTSSSMLADRLVNIIRLRNMEAGVQRKAEKWTRTLATVDWLLAQLPPGADYQVVAFGNQARFALPDTADRWLPVADRAILDKVSAELRQVVPTGGTSLENAFLALQRLVPAPDNIFLITDGLPTQGAGAPRGGKVSGKQRQELFASAVKKLPPGVPVNVILEPLEGDPMAAANYWRLAQVSQGSFLSPSRDWP
ncbi:VWA domain-containing protein [Mangrovimicrobium sediminis]|uniref:VWA domain-containing protein n=1 Tax=Mangrovimicrobium sediminis TaxID=2562682 RepID=A0A4Z0M8E5_9GAMM|nr:vWA domain-containing protein [Haliea sp. SAOS-164]TGD75744.1 VWA domain-containing protein [Haliea sp. SAOS-164]